MYDDGEWRMAHTLTSSQRSALQAAQASAKKIAAEAAVAAAVAPPPAAPGPDVAPPPPPAGWQWPYEGEKLEVEVELENGSTKWVPATVRAVLVDSNFQCVIHQSKTEDFEDWFTWQDENKDWRRPKPKVDRQGSVDKSQAGGKRRLSEAGPPLKWKVAMNRDAHEAELLSSTVEPRGAGKRFPRSHRPVRLDMGNEPLLVPHLGFDQGLVGTKARCLVSKARFVAARIVDYSAASRKHTVKLDSGKGVCDLVLPDHTVDIEVDRHYCLHPTEDEQPGLVATHHQFEGGPASGIRLLISRASVTGYRHVRPSEDQPGTFELAIYDKGRERVMGGYVTAVEAAAAYAEFVTEENFQLKAEAEKQLRLEAEGKVAADKAPRKSGGGGDGEGRLSLGGKKKKDDDAPWSAGGGSSKKKKKAGEGSSRQSEAVQAYDETLCGRRVRVFQSRAARYIEGTILEFLPVESKRRAQTHGRYLVRFDDGEEEELTLPDESCRLLPDGDDLVDSELTDDEQRKVYAAAAAKAELEAKVTVAAEGLKLHESDKTDTGYRCVYAHYQSKLGVVSYEVRANRDSKTVHLGRYKSKLEAAVVFARYMMGQGFAPSNAAPGSAAGFGNLVVMPEALPDSMEGGTKNTVERILDLRLTEVFELAPPKGATKKGGKHKHKASSSKMPPAPDQASVATYEDCEEEPADESSRPAPMEVEKPDLGSGFRNISVSSPRIASSPCAAAAAISAAASSPSSKQSEAGPSSSTKESKPDKDAPKEMPTVGTLIEVECDDGGDGPATWKSGEVRLVVPSKGRFRVVVDEDEEYVEEFGMEDEGDQWRRGASDKPPPSDGSRPVTKIEEREYLCKLRFSSFRRSKWLTAEEVEADGNLSSNVLKKFLKRLKEGDDIDTGYKTYYNPNRVIAHRNVGGFTEYLVKWEGLQYSEASWESEADLKEPIFQICINRYHALGLGLGLADADPDSRSALASGFSWVKQGMVVEVASKEAQYNGAWFQAKALQIRKGTLLVEHVDRLADEGGEGDEANVSLQRERLPMARVRPAPPKPNKDFRPKKGQVVELHYAGGWWLGVVEAIRKKGEELVDEEEYEQLEAHKEAQRQEREREKRRLSKAAAIENQPEAKASAFGEGTQMQGRDGRMYAVRLDDKMSHRWALVRTQPGASDEAGSSAARLSRSSGGLLPAPAGDEPSTDEPSTDEPQPAADEPPPHADEATLAADEPAPDADELPPPTDEATPPADEEMPRADEQPPLLGPSPEEEIPPSLPASPPGDGDGDEAEELMGYAAPPAVDAADDADDSQMDDAEPPPPPPPEDGFDDDNQTASPGEEDDEVRPTCPPHPFGPLLTPRELLSLLTAAL